MNLFHSRSIGVAIAITAAAQTACTPAWSQQSPWDVIAARAATAPAAGWSPERAAMQDRDHYKAYYASLGQTRTGGEPQGEPANAAWLPNLPDTPRAPRFPLTGKVWPEKPGDASICLWEDDKTAAYSFSIDDNNAPDVPFWLDLSKRYGGLNITWNLITINVDGAFDKRRSAPAGSWEFWKQVVDSGFHVESHSVTHAADPVSGDGWPGPDWEAKTSMATIDAHLPGRRTKLFAYPGSAIKEFNTSYSWRPAVSRYYAAARGFSGNPINPANAIDYFDIRTTSHPESAFAPQDPRFAAFDIRNILERNPDPRLAKYYRGWATTFIHSVNGGRDWGASPSTKAQDAIFAWVDAHRTEIWIGFLGDVALYGEERDAGAVQTTEADDSRVVLSLTSRMDPAVFDYPLTVKVRLPDAWSGAVSAEQDGGSLECRAIEYGGQRFALVKARPNRGAIILKP